MWPSDPARPTGAERLVHGLLKELPPCPFRTVVDTRSRVGIIKNEGGSYGRSV
jgi:hypothetical protein